MENSDKPQSLYFDTFINATENRVDKATQIDKNISSIKTKEKLLYKAAQELKADFIGLNEQIDKLVIYIRPWVLMPESLRRPIVISLWGMTGVGKTTLVQALIEKLKLSNSLIKNDFGRLVGKVHNDYLFQSLACMSGRSGVLFFDEFQIARTIDENGREIDRPSLRDFWSLIDHGKLEVSKSILEYLSDYWKGVLQDSFYYNEPKKLVLSPSGLREILPYLNLNETCTKLFYKASVTTPLEMAKWIISKIKELEQKPPVLDFSKCLVILAGNVDESFAHTNTVAPVLLTPEELTEKTQKVSTSFVKEGLLRRFRPEQVARLGTSFVIFKNLEHQQYKKIIDKHLNLISKNIKESFFLSINFTKSVNSLIAKNGVVPSQGVRPILSTIGEIIESRVPTWLITMYKSKHKSATVDFDESTLNFKLMANGQCLIQDKLLYDKNSEIDNIKLSDEELKYFSVHEAGHIVVSISSYGLLPIRVIFEEGLAQSILPEVRFKEFKIMTRAIFESTLAALLAGHVAEEMFFGETGVSSGASQDFREATDIVSFMISNVGMGAHLGVSLNDSNYPQNLTSFKSSDDNEKLKILESSYSQAKKILLEQKNLFKAISNEFYCHKRLSIKRLQELVKKHYEGPPEEVDLILKRKTHKAYDNLQVSDFEAP